MIPLYGDGAWPPGLWSLDRALLAFMPSVYGMEGSSAIGPRSWSPLPTSWRSAAGRPLQSQGDGLSEPWRRVGQLWPRSSPKGPASSHAVDPTYLWTPEGPDNWNPEWGQLSWAFLLPFSFYLPQGFYFYFAFISLKFLNSAILNPPPLFLFLTFSTDLCIWLCYTQVR